MYPTSPRTDEPAQIQNIETLNEEDYEILAEFMDIDEDVVFTFEKPYVPFVEGTLRPNLDMKHTFDMDLNEIVSMNVVEHFHLFGEWEGNDLSFYLARQSEDQVPGMITVVLTNRKTQEKTIRQIVQVLGDEGHMLPITFDNAARLFSYKVLVELFFDREDEIIEKNKISVVARDGNILLDESEIVTFNIGTIDTTNMTCYTQFRDSVFEILEIIQARKMVRKGLHADDFLKLYNLTEKYDLKTLTDGQPLSLAETANLTICEMLMVAEVFEMEEVANEALGRLLHQMDIRLLGNFTKFFGPKTIRKLLDCYKTLPNYEPYDPHIFGNIVPNVESKIMNQMRLGCSPKTCVKLPALKEMVDNIWTRTTLNYDYPFLRNEKQVHLKQTANMKNPPYRPASIQSVVHARPKFYKSTHALAKSEFDVYIKHANNITFFINYADTRNSTLWQIDTNITVTINRSDGSKLFECSTKHSFAWNTMTCVIHATNRETVRKHYTGNIQFVVKVEILESEGFTRVDPCYRWAAPGSTIFTTDDMTSAKEEIQIPNVRIGSASSVVLKMINDSPEVDEEAHIRRVNLPDISAETFLALLTQKWSGKTVTSANMYKPEIQELAVAARLLQHKDTLVDLTAAIQKFSLTEVLYLSERLDFDEVQNWAIKKAMSSNENFKKIDLDILGERSLAAILLGIRFMQADFDFIELDDIL